jgi:hypothetical protein
MSGRKPFGDICQNLAHDFMTLPVTYPFTIRELEQPNDLRSIRARYKCELCGETWHCFWAATDEEIEQWENEHFGDAA